MKRNILLKWFAVVLMSSVALTVNAQWSLGIKGGWDYTSITRSNAGRIDETHSPLSGYDVGIQARYGFTDWFALRADLSVMRRSHRMDRHLNYLDSLYTEHHNLYLMLPVLADFSFGGEHFRGHAMLGGYVGYWLQERRKGKTYWMTDYYVFFDDFNEVREFTSEDRRFNAGLVGGVGLSYLINEHWGLNLDAIYYYDLVSHRRSSPHLRDPRYLNTLSVTFGASYTF
ncbi:MAG: outer membrane beta-barrel protein [Bacteroidales bacterium]|nr:outer membrane beta-barrel protein [Bacteroidales bacterium]